jgi:diguanylate cyclase (GGDEF)-like protein
MPDDVMLEIISLCLSIDAKAAKIYHELAQIAVGEELRAFWKTMAGEEREHVDFWRQLLHSAREGMVPELFERPFDVKQDLVAIQEKLESVLAQSKRTHEPLNAFVVAFRTEFYLMHPAINEFFHLVGLTSEDADFEQRYDDHLSQFITGLNEFGASTPEMELLGEAIKKLWSEDKNLVSQSHTDSLTGLFNRRGLLHAMVPLSNLAQRNGRNVGILMLDLDRFKGINDSHGHLVGDAVIRRVSHVVAESLRKADVVGRFGGEEFLVYLSDVAPDHLLDVAEKIRSAVESEGRSVMGGYLPEAVTVSVGAAQGILRGSAKEAVDQLVKKADQALYKAKETGRNKVVIADN